MFSSFFETTEIDLKIVTKNGEHMLGYDEHGRTLNTRMNVLRSMVRAICFHYKSIPDYRTMTEDEIVFFYDGIRGVIGGK